MTMTFFSQDSSLCDRVTETVAAGSLLTDRQSSQNTVDGPLTDMLGSLLTPSIGQTERESRVL